MTAAPPPSPATSRPSPSAGYPRVVAAGQGTAWWGKGIRLFLSSFWTWIGIMLVYVVISLLIGLLPMVGDFGHWLLTPVFMGGLMLGCHSLDHGERLTMAHLFEGFQRTHFVQLLIIGAVNIGITLVIGFVVAAGVLGGFRIADWRGFGMSADPLQSMLQSFGAIGVSGVLLGLLALVFATVMAMLNWFAPALVAIDGRSAIEAMKRSFSACMANWLAFLIYGLVAVAVAIAAILLVIGLGLLVGAGTLFSNSGLGAMFGLAVLFGVLAGAMVLVVGPITFGSTYAAYADTLAGADDTTYTPA